jgi:hypothetical protein
MLLLKKAFLFYSWSPSILLNPFPCFPSCLDVGNLQVSSLVTTFLLLSLGSVKMWLTLECMPALPGWRGQITHKSKESIPSTLHPSSSFPRGARARMQVLPIGTLIPEEEEHRKEGRCTPEAEQLEVDKDPCREQVQSSCLPTSPFPQSGVLDEPSSAKARFKRRPFMVPSISGLHFLP